MAKVRPFLGILSLLFTILILGYGFLKGLDLIDIVLNIIYFTVLLIDQIYLILGKE